MAKKFIQTAIKRPGRVKNAAKRAGISVHAQAVKMSHSKDPSARGAGNLALRFQKGGDLHGGVDVISPGSMKGKAVSQDHTANLNHKKAFRSGSHDARDGGAGHVHPSPLHLKTRRRSDGPVHQMPPAHLRG